VKRLGVSTQSHVDLKLRKSITTIITITPRGKG